MRPCALRRGIFSLVAWATILATGLLSASACHSQTNAADKPSTQSQSGATDKPSQKDDQSSDGTTTRLRIRVTNTQDNPVGNASVYVRSLDVFRAGFVRSAR